MPEESTTLFDTDLVLTERLAVGGMGEVFRAVQMGVGGFEKSVAVKRILPKTSADEQFRKLFLRETSISANLQHPNIVQVFRNGEYDGYLYLVMEYISGKDLDHLIEVSSKLERPIPVPVCCFIIAEIARALDYAYNYQDEETGVPLEIVHRDVSPTNIMVGYSGVVKLVDFGIARAANTEKLTKTGFLRGKESYFAPEIIEGDAHSHQSDIFALGVCFYELLARAPLFNNESPLANLKNIHECNIPPIEDFNEYVDDELKRILSSMLERRPDDRVTSAGALASELTNYLMTTYPDFTPRIVGNLMKSMFENEIALERERKASSLSRAKEAASNASLQSVEVPPSLSRTFNLRLPFLVLILVTILSLAYMGKVDFYVAPVLRPYFPALGLQSFLDSNRHELARKTPTVPPERIDALEIAYIAGDAKFDDDGHITAWDGGYGTKHPLTQDEPSFRPLVNYNMVNGYPAVSFDGVQSIALSQSTPLLTGSSLTVIFIARARGVLKQPLLSVTAPNKKEDIFRISLGPQRWSISSTQPKSIEQSSVEVDADEFAIYSLRISANEVVGWRNGVEVLYLALEAPLPLSDVHTLTLGTAANSSGSSYFKGDIAELLFFQEALQDNDLIAAEKYLGSKYSITIYPEYVLR